MKLNLRALVLSLSCLFAVVVFGRAAGAATQQPQGITVSPAFQQVQVPDGVAEQPVNFTITNDKTAPQTVNLSVADFNTLNESGGLFFVGTNPTALQKKYGLAKWISLPSKQLTIPAKKTVTVQASILNLPTLTPGGHYGALMIALAGGQGGNNSIGVKPIASSLLFITKVPGDTHRLSLSNVYVKHSLTTLPKNVSLRFYNGGNTHVVPRGVVKLIDPKGNTVSQGTINQSSGIILPVSYRVYQVDLNKISQSNELGSYKLAVDFRFDGISQFRSYQTSFVYVPVIYVATLIAILAGVIILVVIFVRKRTKSNKRTIKVNVK